MNYSYLAGCALAVALIYAFSLPAAQAKGCIKGAIVGGVAGHYAGHHGVIGAMGGCVAGRHLANEKAKQQQQQRAAPTNPQ